MNNISDVDVECSRIFHVLSGVSVLGGGSCRVVRQSVGVQVRQANVCAVVECCLLCCDHCPGGSCVLVTSLLCLANDCLPPSLLISGLPSHLVFVSGQGMTN